VKNSPAGVRRNRSGRGGDASLVADDVDYAARGYLWRRQRPVLKSQKSLPQQSSLLSQKSPFCTQQKLPLPSAGTFAQS
jgi:hypothetical protein